MSELKLCRICLNKDVKLFKLEQCNLKEYYEQIMRSKVLSKDELPRYFCVECAALLHKYHKFKEKCDYGQSTLKKLLCSGFMTHYVIEDIRRNRSDFQPTTDYINYLSGKRIKTVNITHKHEMEPLEMENVIISSQTDAEPLKYEYMPDSDNELTGNVMKYELEYSEPSITNTKPLFTDLTHQEPSNKANESVPKTEQTYNELRDYSFSDNNDSESDLVMDVNVDLVKVSNEDDMPLEDLKKTRKQRAVKKEEKKEGQAKDPDTNHRFVGIIREPKGELSKGNWETILLTEEEAIEQFKKKEFESKYERMEFKCTKCFKGFSKNEMLLRHNKMWHEKGENECRFCHMQFKWKSKLQVHMMNHYYIYKCLRCGLQFYLKNGAVFHDGHHNGVIHKCKHCGEEYTHVAAFHDSQHNGVRHTCGVCGEVYSHISTYYTHLRTSHRNAHACKICGATFVSQTGVVVHMKRKHVMHTQNEEPSTDIYCQKCEISFVSQSAYDEHLSQSKLHEDENKDFKRTVRKRREILANAARCIHCNKKFKSKTEVKAHIAADHPGQNKVERVVCEICGAVLSSAYIEIHMNRHTRKKVYPCQTCGKEFLCVTSHNTHQLTHSGEKPHPCPICPKRFGLKGHMEVHYKRVHLKEPYPKSVQKPKPTDCPVCHKTFQSRSHMDTHLRRVHLKEPYPKSGPKLCPICSKPFAYASDMDVHYRRVHLKEPYPKRTYNRKNRNRQSSEVPLYATLPK